MMGTLCNMDEIIGRKRSMVCIQKEVTRNLVFTMT